MKTVDSTSPLATQSPSLDVLRRANAPWGAAASQEAVSGVLSSLACVEDVKVIKEDDAKQVCGPSRTPRMPPSAAPRHPKVA